MLSTYGRALNHTSHKKVYLSLRMPLNLYVPLRKSLSPFVSLRKALTNHRLSHDKHLKTEGFLRKSIYKSKAPLGKALKRAHDVPYVFLEKKRVVPYGR